MIPQITKITFRSHIIICILLVLSFTFTSSCTKKEHNSNIANPLETWGNTLMTKVPNNAFGVVYWNTQKSAYDKYMSSNWNTSNSRLIDDGIATSNKFIKTFITVIKRAGYSPDNSNWTEIFSENVLFASNDTTNNNGLYFALITKSADKNALEKLIAALKQTIIDGEAFKIIPVQGQNPEAFGLEITSSANNAGTKALYFDWKDNLMIISSSSRNLSQILMTDKKELPTFFKTPEYKKATKGFPYSQDIISFAYADFNAIKDMLEPALVALQKLTTAKKLSQFPFAAFAMAVSMDKELAYNIRLLNNEQETSKELINTNIFQSSMYETVKVVGNKPLALLSIDGKTLKNILDNVSNINSKNNILEIISDYLTNTKRVSIVANSAIPMPEIMLVLESSNANKDEQDLKKTISTLMLSNNTANTWKRITYDKYQIDHLDISNANVGIYVLTFNDLILISSSENIIKTSLASSKIKNITSTMSKDAKETFAKDGNASNLFLDFGEIAGLMERFGGIVGMFIKNEPTLKQMFEPKELDKIRRMGVTITTVTTEDDQSVRVKMLYTKKQ